MTRLEMIQKLAENPKRKAKMVIDCDGNGIANYNVYIVNEKGEIIELVTNTKLYLTIKGDLSEWEIIEPKKELRKMSFGEAIYYSELNSKMCREVKSCLTGLDYSRNEISLEEYTGLWTVEGIYEEEEPPV